MNRLGLAVLGLAACYNPSTVTLLCPAGQSDCPVDQRCVDGLCTRVVGGTDDMSIIDLASTDGATPADLAQPGGCKAGKAIVVGAKVRACPGTFPAVLFAGPAIRFAQHSRPAISAPAATSRRSSWPTSRLISWVRRAMRHAAPRWPIKSCMDAAKRGTPAPGSVADSRSRWPWVRA